MGGGCWAVLCQEIIIMSFKMTEQICYNMFSMSYGNGVILCFVFHMNNGECLMGTLRRLGADSIESTIGSGVTQFFGFNLVLF